MKYACLARYGACSWLLAAASSAQFEPASTVFTTWADDPCTTMTVQWLEQGPTPARLEGSAEASSIAWDVPRFEGMPVIDGDAGDWGAQGTRIDYLGGPDHEWPDPTGFVATAKLAHTDAGLLVLIEVIDDEATEGKDNALYAGDSVELFLGERVGGGPSYQLVIAPGKDPEHAAMRTQFFDRRGGVDPAPLTSLQAASRVTEKGYVIEALLPWAGAVGDMSAMPAGAAMQLIVNDLDGPFDRERLAWFPSEHTSADASAMHPLRLGNRKDDPTRARVDARVADTDDQEHDGIVAGSVVLDLGGEPRLIGETVVVRSGTRKLAEATLDDTLGFAGKVIPLPPEVSSDAASLEAVTVTLDDRVIARCVVDPWVFCGKPSPRNVQATSDGPEVVSAPTTVRLLGRGFFVQSATLRGLMPGMDYVFGAQGLPAVEGVFRTAPAMLDTPMHVSEGGDIGTSEYVAPLLRQAASRDPLFAVVGGDLAYADGRNIDRWVRYLQLWSEHMRVPTPLGDRLIPMVVTIGNHEAIGGFAEHRDRAPLYYTLFADAFKKLNYTTLDFGRNEAGAPYLSFLLLDSGHSSKVHPRQTDWLRDRLAERDDATFVFPIYHVPAYPSARAVDDGPRGEVRRAMREHWVPLFQQHRVGVVFEHDDHAYKRTFPLLNGEPVSSDTPGAVVYLGDGAWGMGDRKVRDQPYLEIAKPFRHFFHLTLMPDGSLTAEAIDGEGVVFDRYEAGPRR